MVKKIRRTILVIDDEPDIVNGLKDLLEEYDYHVLTTTDGSDGLAKLNEVTPNLILLDVAMPKLNGFEVLSQLKKNPKTSFIPVIMLTAKVETGTIWEAQKMEAVNYVVKPFNSEDLLKWIRVYET